MSKDIGASMSINYTGQYDHVQPREKYVWRTLKRRVRCEKCNKLTNRLVLVVDRWAAWCGCAP